MKSFDQLLRKEVTILGANGLFSKVTSLLLKRSPALNILNLFDYDNVEAGDDLKLIKTKCRVRSHSGKENIVCALKTADVILLSDYAVLGSSFYNPHSEFLHKAKRLTEYVAHIAAINSAAIVVVATSPVNFTLPFVNEILNRLGKLDISKVLGMTNVDVIRANSLFASHLHVNPRSVWLPVVGGSSQETRVPLFSKARPAITFNLSSLQKLSSEIKTFDIQVHGAIRRSELLNRGYATARLINAVLAGLEGKEGVIETVMSQKESDKGMGFISLPVELGKEGIQRRISLPTVTEYESRLLKHAIKALATDVTKAKDYVNSNVNIEVLKSDARVSKLTEFEKSQVSTKLLEKIKIHQNPVIAEKSTLNKKLEKMLTEADNESKISKISILSDKTKKENLFSKMKLPNDKIPPDHLKKDTPVPIFGKMGNEIKINNKIVKLEGTSSPPPEAKENSTISIYECCTDNSVDALKLCDNAFHELNDFPLIVNSNKPANTEELKNDGSYGNFIPENVSLPQKCITSDSICKNKATAFLYPSESTSQGSTLKNDNVGLTLESASGTTTVVENITKLAEEISNNTSGATLCEKDKTITTERIKVPNKDLDVTVPCSLQDNSNVMDMQRVQCTATGSPKSKVVRPNDKNGSFTNCHSFQIDKYENINVCSAITYGVVLPQELEIFNFYSSGKNMVTKKLLKRVEDKLLYFLSSSPFRKMSSKSFSSVVEEEIASNVDKKKFKPKTEEILKFFREKRTLSIQDHSKEEQISKIIKQKKKDILKVKFLQNFKRVKNDDSNLTKKLLEKQKNIITTMPNNEILFDKEKTAKPVSQTIEVSKSSSSSLNIHKHCNNTIHLKTTNSSSDNEQKSTQCCLAPKKSNFRNLFDKIKETILEPDKNSRENLSSTAFKFEKNNANHFTQAGNNLLGNNVKSIAVSSGACQDTSSKKVDYELKKVEESAKAEQPKVAINSSNEIKSKNTLPTADLKLEDKNNLPALIN